MSISEVLKKFDKLMIPPKFIKSMEGKDCPICGHPMPNSRGTELLKQFLTTTLKEAMEEVKPKRRNYYKDFGAEEYNQALEELQQNITNYFEN